MDPTVHVLDHNQTNNVQKSLIKIIYKKKNMSVWEMPRVDIGF